MNDARHFLLFWLVNSFVLYFAPLVLVGLVVSGNSRLTPFMASVISGFLLTVLEAIAEPAFTSLKIKLKDEWQWSLAYLFINVVAVWLIARYADLTGVGVASGWVAILLGLVLNLGQWVVWKMSVPPKSSK